MNARFGSLVIAVSVLALGMPAAGSAHSSVTAFMPCDGAAQVRPTTVVFACGDGGVYATNVRWMNWGQPFATATATMHENDCTPNCAQGHFHVYAAYLALSGSQRCGARLTYARAAYVARTRGLPNPRTHLDWQEFPCH